MKHRWFGIEITPVDKWCEQQCPHCPLSSKNKPIQSNAIDTHVQETFSALEKILNIQQTTYDLHFSSKTQFFPSIKNPDIIKMVRFQPNTKDIKKNNTEWLYTQEIKDLLDNHCIKPQEVAFSFVPQSPILSRQEINSIKSMIAGIKQWHFTGKTPKTLSCTIRSNFLSEHKFTQLKDKLNNVSKKQLTILTSPLHPQHVYEEKDFEDLYTLYHQSKISNQEWAHTLHISNRTIGHKKITQQTVDTIKEQLSENTQKIIDPMIHQISYFKWSGVLITPEWVMIEHTSITINNPIFWVNHDDFIHILSSTTLSDIRDICKEIIEENINMYLYIKKQIEEKGLARLSKKEYMDIFAANRQILKDNKK